ncbi:hypothetical protein RAAC3_TM7C00001G0266 [Candidatus Saccharibacteria bacterium RAAC3_TM7_1]|nr:hypothetical protein RAAC3_TM7C00001G0266 [Candidatus Saccharibacteria bacterium RAAC3_TM7_1]HCZ28249.1 hypothetical protein [Candidatus Saccharibacteria bacterium]
MLDTTSVDPTQITDQLTQQFAGILMLVIIVSLVLTAIILTLWIVSLVRKWQMQKAISEMRDILREINERQKQQTPLHDKPVVLKEERLP